MNQYHLILPIALAGGLLAASAIGQESAKTRDRVTPKADADKSEAPKPEPKKSEQDLITPEREAAAVTFAQTHHPELADLLGRLKKGKHKEYQRALQELFRTSERLAHIQERTPKQYDFELKSWKLTSRIRLLQARMTMSDDRQLEDELRGLLRERAELKLARLKAERALLEDSLGRVNEKIAEAEKSLEPGIEKELTLLKQNVARGKEKKRVVKEKVRADSTPTKEPGKDAPVKSDKPRSARSPKESLSPNLPKPTEKSDGTPRTPE